jgi:hypothetical protein
VRASLCFVATMAALAPGIGIGRGASDDDADDDAELRPSVHLQSTGRNSEGSLPRFCRGLRAAFSRVAVKRIPCAQAKAVAANRKTHIIACTKVCLSFQRPRRAVDGTLTWSRKVSTIWT